MLDIASMTPDQMKLELVNERKRCIVMEKDLFRA